MVLNNDDHRTSAVHTGNIRVWGVTFLIWIWERALQSRICVFMIFQPNLEQAHRMNQCQKANQKCFASLFVASSGDSIKLDGFYYFSPSYSKYIQMPLHIPKTSHHKNSRGSAVVHPLAFHSTCYSGTDCTCFQNIIYCWLNRRLVTCTGNER